MPPTYSLVAPVFNEEATVEEFYTRVCAALDEIREILAPATLANSPRLVSAAS